MQGSGYITRFVMEKGPKKSTFLLSFFFQKCITGPFREILRLRVAFKTPKNTQKLNFEKLELRHLLNWLLKSTFKSDLNKCNPTMQSTHISFKKLIKDSLKIDITQLKKFIV